jgi:hypothetical protein
MASGLIVTGLIMLIISSTLIAYFAPEMELNSDTLNLIGMSITLHEGWDFLGDCSNTTIIQNEGSWICGEYGLIASGANKNLFFLHNFDILAQREEEKTYRFAVNINNTAEELMFYVYIAQEFAIPLSSDAIRVKVDESGMYLERYATFFNIYDPVGSDIYATCINGNSTQEEFFFSLSWDINTGIISVYEDESGCYMEGNLVGQIWNSGPTTKYLGGAEADGPGLIIESIYEDTTTEKKSSIAEGDFIGFFMDIIGVMGWQTSPEILPYIIQGIVIGIPEMMVFVGVAALLYPGGD